MIEMNGGDEPIEANPITSVVEMKHFPVVKFIGETMQSDDRVDEPITYRSLPQIIDLDSHMVYHPMTFKL